LQRIYRNKTKDLLEVKMANDSQRDKARATFGKTFFENSKALPNPKNAAAALQKRANDRPIPTYKVGGAVKKAMPPQPTAAEREADRKRRESLAKAKVTQSEADTLGRSMRAEGPGYKDGGKANAGAKRAMKAEQDFTGLMRDAAARAAAKGTPVMKQGGATNEYTAKRVMSRIKAGNFKDGGRAELLRDRRMKDIEKDYKIALAKGKNEGVAKAKYEQRKADAADDYAKRTKGDRTATRAAEKASEAALKEARSTKGMSMLARGEPKAVTTEASVAKVTDSLGSMSVPKMDRSIGAKPAAKTPAKTPARRVATTRVVPPATAPATTTRVTTPAATTRVTAPAAAAPAAAAKPKPTYNAIRSPGALSGISFDSGPSAPAPKPTSAKKPVDSIANRVAAMFTTKAMAQKNAEFAKSQKARVTPQVAQAKSARA
jgi:hypothetical protein